MKKFVMLFAIFALVSCKDNIKESAPVVKTDIELKGLFDIMQGTYDSEAQSKVDSTYYNISLHMYAIWKDKGNYIYVEQALKETQNKPYRQRVYELTRINDSVISSEVYKIPNDSLWIGKWETPEDFNSISPSDLEIREGCAVLLKRIGPLHYKGATSNDACKSTLRGASYAASSVEVTNDVIISWDQGFDLDGNQVWGAEKGGYIFNRIK